MTTIADALARTGITPNTFAQSKETLVACSFSHTASGITVWLPMEVLKHFEQGGATLTVEAAGTQLHIRPAMPGAKGVNKGMRPVKWSDEDFRLAFQPERLRGLTPLHADMFGRSKTSGTLGRHPDGSVLLVVALPHHDARVLYTPFKQPNKTVSPAEPQPQPEPESPVPIIADLQGAVNTVNAFLDKIEGASVSTISGRLAIRIEQVIE